MSGIFVLGFFNERFHGFNTVLIIKSSGSFYDPEERMPPPLERDTVSDLILQPSFL